MRQALRIGLMLVAGSPVLGCARTLPPLADSCITLHAELPDSIREGDSDSLDTALPSRVHLTTRAGDRDPLETWAVDFVPGATPSIHAIRFWQPIEPDSVFIVLSTGYAGVGLKLQNGTGVLRGTAETFFDYKDGVVVAASARRIDCDAPVPPDERYVSRLPGEVSVASRDVALRIGDVLDTAVFAIDSTWQGSEFLSVEPMGVFRGANEVSVRRAPDGTVERIELWFPPEATADRVLARLTAEWGPPQGRGLWVDRRHRIHVYDHIRPEPHSRVVAVLGR